MKKTALICLGIFLISFLYYFAFMPYGITLLGEGYFAYGAKQVMDGKIPYKEIAFFGHPPLQFYPLGFFMKLFDFSLFSERLYYLLIGSLIAVLIFLLTKRLTNNTLLSLGPSALYIFFTSLKGERLLIPLIGVTLMLYSDFISPNKKTGRLAAFAVGVLCALSLMAGQEYTLAVATSIFLVFVFGFLYERKTGKNSKARNLFSKLFFSTIGFFAGILPFIYFFYKNNALIDMLFYLFYFPIKIYPASFGTAWPNILSLASSFAGSPNLRNLYHLANASMVYSLVILSVVVVLMAGTTIWKKRKESEFPFYEIMFFALFSFIMIIRAFPKPEITNLFQTVIPAIILFFFLAGLHIKRAKSRVFVSIIAIISLLLCLYGQVAVNPMLHAQESNFLILMNEADYTKIDIERAENIYSRTIPAEDISNVASFIKTNTDYTDYIFAVPYECMFYLLSDRDNPTKYNQFAPNILSEEEQGEVISVLESKKPKFVIYGKGWQINDIPFKEAYPIIDQEIMNSCRLREAFGDYEIYQCMWLLNEAT